MKIGIIKETKIPKDKRTAVIPEHCNILQNPPFNFDIKVAPCSFRSYADFEYLNEQIQLTDQLEDCDILLGIKEVNIDTLIPGKTYFFFSHTIKKQPQNRKLLQAVLNLIDSLNGLILVFVGKYGQKQMSIPHSNTV